MRFKNWFLILFLVSPCAHAQVTSFTDPNVHDLKFAHKALESCKVLTDVVDDNSHLVDIPAQKLFLELQKQDSNGNLLIDNEACRQSILEFVSSLCSSDSPTNNLYCARLGIRKSSDDSTTRDYKKFGQSAIDDLDIDTSDNISFEPTIKEAQSKMKFLAAGTLFYLSPVKKLRPLSLVGQNVAIRVKPVLSGAMLLLATMGLSSCGDLTEPALENQCDRSEEGYFSLDKNDGSKRCIKIPRPTISYIDGAGNEHTQSDGITNHSIKIKFNSVVGFIRYENWQALTNQNLPKMLEISLENGGANFLNDEDRYNVQIGIEGGSYVLITPIQPYQVGRYNVKVKNYALESDAVAILNSINKTNYLEETLKEFSFTANRIETPCTRGESGYFQLEGGDRACIELPEVDYTFTPNGGSESNVPNGDPTTTIKIKFDSEVMYLGTSGSARSITKNDLLEMLEIKPAGGSDLVASSGSIGLGQLSVSHAGGRTLITVQPPNGSFYPAGSYIAMVKNYVKRDDASRVTGATNKSAYFNTIREQISFTANSIETPCTRGEAGHFQLEGGDRACIELSQVNYTFTPRGGTESNTPNGDPSTTIKIKFNSEVMFINNSGSFSSLSTQNILDMVEIKLNGGSDIVTSGGLISHGQVSFSSGGNTVITIQPPNGAEYPAGNYTVLVKNYVKRDDATKVAQSTNKSSYFNTIIERTSFRANSVETPCTRGEAGYFSLNKRDGSVECIRLPRVNYTFTPKSGSESSTPNGDPTTVVKVKFDSEVMFLNSSGNARNITKNDLLEMLEIRRSNGADLVTQGGAIGTNQVSVTHAGSRTVITIQPPGSNQYQDGSYNIRVGKFVKRENSSVVSQSTNRISYLNAIRNSSVFNIDEEEEENPCDSNEAGYFQLSGANAECIKLPQVTYTFNSSSKAALPTGTEATIKIEFDSEVMFLDKSGQSSLTTEKLLEMLDVRHEFFTNDFITYYEDSISVSNTNGRTVITMKAPDIFDNGDKVYYSTLFGDFTLSIGNYVKSQDAQKVLNATNTSSYLRSVSKQKVFAVSSSCNDIRYAAPMLADEGDQEDKPFVCGTDEITKEQLKLLEHLPTDPSMQAQVLSRRADPGTTYYVDVAFIVSQDALASQSLSTWRKELEQYYIPKVNEIYQNSGVNVEFRVKAVKAFSEYRRYLACSENVPSLDGLAGAGDDLNILRELAPRIRREHGADLIHGVLMYGTDGLGGIAYRRLKDQPAILSARFSSVGSTSHDTHRNYFTVTLAHELGHNLGLSHDKDTLSESEVGGGEYPDPNNFHGAGHGYGGRYSNLEVGTIMSYSRHDQQLSLFSANQTLSKSQICQDDVFDNQFGVYGYCNINTGVPGSKHISIGDADANSSEALQYTIEDASNYSNYSTPARSSTTIQSDTDNIDAAASPVDASQSDAAQSNTTQYIIEGASNNTHAINKSKQPKLKN